MQTVPEIATLPLSLLPTFVVTQNSLERMLSVQIAMAPLRQSCLMYSSGMTAIYYDRCIAFATARISSAAPATKTRYTGNTADRQILLCTRATTELFPVLPKYRK